MPILHIKNRTGANVAAGKPTTLHVGELAYNEGGAVAADKAAGGALFVGGHGGSIKSLVSSARQVEVTGDQIITGKKHFKTGVAIGDPLANGYDLPVAIGNPGETLTVTAAGDVIDWAAAAGVVIKGRTVTGTTGTLEGDFNAAATPFVVETNKLYILHSTSMNKTFIWVGPVGEYGTAAGKTPVTPDMFIMLDSGAVWATVTEIADGTVSHKAIDPATARHGFVRTSNQVTKQVVRAGTTEFGTLTDDSGALKLMGKVMLGSSIGGVKPGKLEMAKDSTIYGANGNYTINDAIIDCGTF